MDRLTKFLLAVIAASLGVIALQPLLRSQPALADSSFSGLQLSATGAAFFLFDTRSGDLWFYQWKATTDWKVVHHTETANVLGRLTVGEPPATTAKRHKPPL
jgi:hypothetical protein